MTLDIPTLFVVTIFISAMAGVLMLLSWLQNRAVTALLWWGAAYIIGAVAASLIAGRGHVPDFWSINIGTALLLATAGMTWCGVRVFDERYVTPWYALCASAIWLAACGIPDFYQSLLARIFLSSVLAFGYAALAVWELWRSRHDGMLARCLAMGIFGFHGLMFLTRIFFSLIAELPLDGDLLKLQWLRFGIFESLFYAFCTAFVLLTLTKERAEARHMRAANIDPLTGVSNRRGFIARAADVLARCREEAQPAAVLVFDLDHFKAINDSFGHQVGDDVLVAFCRVVQQRIGPRDVFGRLGGEEFVCVLPGAKAQAAFSVAERIRAAFDTARRAAGAAGVHATVSVGVASSDDAGRELTLLLAAADKALYLAKAKGRNRVEGRRPAPVLVTADVSTVPRGAA